MKGTAAARSAALLCFFPRLPLVSVRVANLEGLCKAGLQRAIADFARERAMSFSPSMIEVQTSLTASWTEMMSALRHEDADARWIRASDLSKYKRH